MELKCFNNLPQIDQIKHAQSVLVQLEFDNVKDNKFLTLKSGRSARLLRHTLTAFLIKVTLTYGIEQSKKSRYNSLAEIENDEKLNMMRKIEWRDRLQLQIDNFCYNEQFCKSF